MTNSENQETTAVIKLQVISFLKTSWGRLIIGILILFLTGKTCVWLTTHNHMIMGCFLAVIVGIIAVGAVMSATWRGGPLVLTIFIFIFAGMIPCFTVKYGGNGDTVRNIMVNDAPKYTSETVFYFLDGKVMKDYYGYEPVMGRHYKVGDAYVAPIVPEDWKPTDPVPAWAYSEYRDPDVWDQEFHAGIRVPFDEVNDYAVKDAEISNHIRSAENAPILMWTNKPGLELNFYKKVGLFLFLFFATIWSIVFWIGELMPAGTKEDAKKKKK